MEKKYHFESFGHSKITDTIMPQTNVIYTERKIHHKINFAMDMFRFVVQGNLSLKLVVKIV